jgi:hypothetical protein
MISLNGVVMSWPYVIYHVLYPTSIYVRVAPDLEDM